MSKRHQASRRRAYGRRQHEIRERTTRRDERPELDLDRSWLEPDDGFAGLDLRFASAFRLALGDS